MDPIVFATTRASPGACSLVLINNAQREHQEFMETVDAVAQEHADAIASLPIDGIAVFPADSPFTTDWYKKANGRHTIDFALNGPAAVSGIILEDIAPIVSSRVVTEGGHL